MGHARRAHDVHDRDARQPSSTRLRRAATQSRTTTVRAPLRRHHRIDDPSRVTHERGDRFAGQPRVVAAHDDSHLPRAHGYRARRRRRHVEQVEHRARVVPLHPAMRRPSPAKRCRCTVSTRHRAPSRTDERRKLLQRRGEVAFDGASRSGHLVGDVDGNEQCVHRAKPAIPAKHTRSTRLAPCMRNASRERNRGDPAKRARAPRHRIHITSRRLRAAQPRGRTICAAQ